MMKDDIYQYSVIIIALRKSRVIWSSIEGAFNWNWSCL